MRTTPQGLADAVLLLPQVARDRVWLLHAWWRASAAMLREQGPAVVRQLTARAIAGEPSDAPGFDALAVVAADCGFSGAQTADVITGLALAAAGWRPGNEAELLGYAYHSGGAIGVMVMRAMGIAEDDGEMLDCASDCGVALILEWLAGALIRGAADAGEMLPGDWLAQAGVAADQLTQPAYRNLRKAFAARLRRLAAPYVQSARYGAAHLRFRCRWAACSLIAGGWPWMRWLSGLFLALQHGPDEAQVPLARAALARAINLARWTDAAGETADPAR